MIFQRVLKKDLKDKQGKDQIAEISSNMYYVNFKNSAVHRLGTQYCNDDLVILLDDLKYSKLDSWRCHENSRKIDSTIIVTFKDGTELMFYGSSSLDEFLEYFNEG